MQDMDVTRRSKMIVGIYGGSWILDVASFWLVCKDPQRAMLHILVSWYVLLPLLIFVLSLLLGMEPIPVEYIWLVPVGPAVTYWLQPLLTLSLYQYVLSGRAAFPEMASFVAAAIVSTAGLLIGIAVKRSRMRSEKRP